jgi:hypothetical protein
VRSTQGRHVAGCGSKAAHVQQPPAPHTASKLPKAVSEADGGADGLAEARKRRWR